VIYRIYPTADTFLTDNYVYPNYTPMTGANVGAAPELQVFKRAGVSGAVGSIGSSSLGRILMQFDLTQFCSLTGSGDLPSNGTFTLQLNHKTTGGRRPTSFDLVVSPVQAPWDEGSGQDVEQLQDAGWANWTMRDSQNYWGTPGGDFWTDITASQHFDTGLEDLSVDVTSMVGDWLGSEFANYGFGIMLTSSIESNSVYIDYYKKVFYARETQYQDRAPYLEYRANDFTHDDRVNAQWGQPVTLYLYNVIGGVFADIPQPILMSVSDASGTLTSVTASRGLVPGVYSASFVLPTGSYSGSVFYDLWGSGSYAYSTGTFSLVGGLPINSIQRPQLTARVRNLQDEYSCEDSPVLEVFFRKRPLTVQVVQTASLSPTPYIVEHGYWAIENDSTGQRVIPFGTGSLQETRLSYGADGNQFRLFMSNLHAGNAYRVLFLVNDNGAQQVIDNQILFKVV
jgi:hypothetical protein